MRRVAWDRQEGSLVVDELRLARSAPERAPRISVIVPVFNGGSNFGRCLQALRASAAAPLWELIVVDDGSADGSADRARAAGARVLATHRPRSGPATARNVGAAVARGELLLFVDADVLVTPRTIADVAAVFAADPALAALFGSYDRRPTASNFVSQYKNLFHHYVHQTSPAAVTTFWAGCGAVRATMFRELGGFDGSYGRPSIEDIEFGYRLTRAGYAVRLCHHIQVTHLKRWTAGSLLRTDIRDRGIPWVQLLLRERVFAVDLNLQTENRISVAGIYLLWSAIFAMMFWPSLAGVALLLTVALLGLNLPLYAFFRRERGALFALAAIPWHWLYYTYNGVCCAVGLACFLRARSAGAVPTPHVEPAPAHAVDPPLLADD